LEPAAKLVVVREAVPLESVAVPSEVVPLKNWTVPVGEPTPGLVTATVAVNVTPWPTVGAVGVKVIVVVVDASATVTRTGAEVFDVKVLSPEYTVVIPLEPTGSTVVSVAMPLVSVWGEPSAVDPLKNCTVPVGVPVAGLTAATVAVNVTSSPKTGALGEKLTVVLEVASAATVTVTAGEVLVEKLASPAYFAVIELAPVVRADVASVAMPLVSVWGEPSAVVPLKNWTVPVGVPAPGLAAATVAVKVTDWPRTGESGVNVTVVVLNACVTVTVTAGEMLDVKVLSPEYTAVIELSATGRLVVSSVATPPVSVWGVPSAVVPLKNWTVPVGVPVPVGATVAVRATD
jgi:hypothetical protein